ncbi:hypothetical protein [Chryseobacterium sp. A301]
MKKLFLLAISAFFTLNACQKTESTSSEHMHEAAMSHAQDSFQDLRTIEQQAKLELNGTDRWETNPEMLPFIQKQETLLADFNASEKSYSQLGKEMNEANEELIKSCTMEGKSHEVLHVWLTEHMHGLEALAGSTDQEQGENALNSLKISMSTYHKYFN